MPDQITAGGNGTDGQLHLLGAEGKPILDVQVTPRGTVLRDANLTLGGAGRGGLLRVLHADDQQAATFSGSNLTLGGKGKGAEKGHQGSIALNNSDGRNPIIMNASNDAGDIAVGDNGVPGRVRVYDGGNPSATIDLDGKRNALSFSKPGTPNTSRVEILGQTGTVRAGGDGVSGLMLLRASNESETIRLTAGDATARAGGNSVNGTMLVRTSNNTDTIRLTAGDAAVRVGGNGVNGTVSVLGADGQPLLELLGRPSESVLGLGQRNRPARLSLYNGNQAEALRLDAATGDIMLLNADAAEEFDVEDGVEPGMVMVLAEDGSLVVSDEPYDTRVAGVVSGAGTYRPGLILDRRDTGRERAPIALMGKVFCLAEATNSPIVAGDLLTTSPCRGHAMRIGDRVRATGAVLGKALAPLRSGRGLIPVLVTLQ